MPEDTHSSSIDKIHTNYSDVTVSEVAIALSALSSSVKPTTQSVPRKSENKHAIKILSHSNTNSDSSDIECLGICFIIDKDYTKNYSNMKQKRPILIRSCLMMLHYY